MPISEAGIIGCAVGMALVGWHPVAEMQYSDFVASGFDQIVNQAAKLHLMSGGQATVPMVLRLPVGAIEHGAQHDQSPEAWFMHTPGLKVVMPSNPADARGLLKSAIRDPNPVVFCEHKALYGTKSVGGRAGDQEPEPDAAVTVEDDDEGLVPLGLAATVCAGSDVTVIATALMVERSRAAAAALEKEGISVEVIDPRTLVPLDRETILGSVRKTGRVVVVTEDARTAGSGAEIAALISEEAFDFLDAPVVRLSGPDLPLPFSGPVQQALIPSSADIAAVCRRLFSGEP
jgi:pyruvate dehydrogenase E1 component beta subunit